MKKLILSTSILIIGYSYADSIKITSPKGGWRDSSTKKVKFSQKVQYPDVDISMPENQPDTGKIEGQILGSIKDSPKPLKLIVNGNAMPLKASNGKFSRPYSFGNGANNVEIRSSDGKTRSNVQFFDVKKGGTQSRIRIILSWDTDGTDLDLHVISPNGEHCYYRNRKLKDGSALDVDVTTGYGPEIFASPGVQKGPYLIYVNYYGRRNSKIITTATVSVITNEGTVDEKVNVRRFPLRHPGELTFVHSFVYL
ncbi:MAG: hypothetical protein CME66_03510 [Halobacteriovoraceae bacterium]|nr:hypothetical protein [Halobacteriovoraceae bacterium]